MRLLLIALQILHCVLQERLVIFLLFLQAKLVIMRR